MAQKKLKKIYLLPNVITAFGLSCGLFVIFKMNMVGAGEITFEILSAAVGLLLIAAVADLLDGAVARAMKAESYFGGIFDSLADAISFGVAPSIIILKSLSLEPGSRFSVLATIAAMVFSLSGVLRLARFNVISFEAREDLALAQAEKKHFTGLPIPAAAAAAVSLVLFLFSPDARFVIPFSPIGNTLTLSLALLLLGYCMISRWKFPSIKSLEVRVASFRTVLLTVVIAVLIFFGLLHHYATVFVLLSWGYILVAWILSIIRIVAGRKSRTLEEFEPEPDELEEDES